MKANSEGPFAAPAATNVEDLRPGPPPPARPLTFRDLAPPPHLGEVFRRLRDRIAAQDRRVNRDELILDDLANLLICKIADERAGERAPSRPLSFQVAGSPSETSVSIRAFFAEVRSRLPSVFPDDADRLHLDDDSLRSVVLALQPYRLLGNDRHAVGKAFEVLRARGLKGEEGAYFTPSALVDCAVAILDPKPGERVIDPACGTGGFLAAALDHLLAGSVGAEVGAAPDVGARDDGDPAEWGGAARNGGAAPRGASLVALDKDAVSAKLCAAYLQLLGDGRARVFRGNAIDRSEWPERGDDLAGVAADGTFDLVLTNPPFGSSLTVPVEVGGREGLLSSRSWSDASGSWVPGEKLEERQLGLAFFERSLGLLKPGGRMAIVLPETFLFSRSFAWFVDWLGTEVTVTHVVDVPMVAFEEFCRAKTCLLVVTKAKPEPGHEIVFSYPRTIGQDRRGNPLLRLDEGGGRTGERDDEMGEAARRLAAPGRAGGSAQGETRLAYAVPQETARRRGILVPRFWWRKDSDDALRRWSAKYPSVVVTLGDLAARGVLSASEGHGSPPGNARATGDVPYVKVTDLKNWRINENPTNFIHSALAAKLRKRGPELRYGDLVSPARASSNIGQFSLVLPWQTGVVLTREVLVLRVGENDEQITPFLLLALMSLKVVQEQYRFLTLMQTNREHLGDAWKEVQVPLPETPEARRRLEGPVRSYFDALVQARESYSALTAVFDPEDFGTRP